MIQGGIYKQFDRLTFLKIEGAGSRVARDRPEVAHQMITQFMKHGELINEELDEENEFIVVIDEEEGEIE